MFYDAKEKKLYSRAVKLSKQEDKMLFLLVNNGICTFEELKKYGIKECNARTLKCRLVNKTNLKLKTIVNVGWKLEEDEKIYFIGGKNE